MKRIAELILYPILAITALVLFIYPALIAPVAFRLPLIVLGLTGIVTCCYVFHWCGILAFSELRAWAAGLGTLDWLP